MHSQILPSIGPDAGAVYVMGIPAPYRVDAFRLQSQAITLREICCILHTPAAFSTDATFQSPLGGYVYNACFNRDVVDDVDIKSSLYNSKIIVSGVGVRSHYTGK